MTDTINVNIPPPPSFFTFKNFFIVMLALACIMLFLTRGCGKQPPVVVTQNNISQDSANKLIAKAEAAGMQTGFLMEDTIRLHRDLKNARDSLKRSTDLVHAANSQVTALVNDVYAALAHQDTVSFYHACDTLISVAKAQTDKFNLYERDSKNALAACDALSLKKTHIIASLTSEANGYKSAYNLEKKQNGILANAITPKRKVFIGGEIFTTVGVSGVGPGVMYEDKKERLYGVSGGIATTGGYWFGGKVYFKLQLH